MMMTTMIIMMMTMMTVMMIMMITMITITEKPTTNMKNKTAIVVAVTMCLKVDFLMGVATGRQTLRHIKKGTKMTIQSCKKLLENKRMKMSCYGMDGMIRLKWIYN